MKKIISINLKSAFFFTMLLVCISSSAQFAIIFDWEHENISTPGEKVRTVEEKVRTADEK